MLPGLVRPSASRRWWKALYRFFTPESQEPSPLKVEVLEVVDEEDKRGGGIVVASFSSAMVLIKVERRKCGKCGLQPR